MFSLFAESKVNNGYKSECTSKISPYHDLNKRDLSKMLHGTGIFTYNLP